MYREAGLLKPYGRTYSGRSTNNSPVGSIPRTPSPGRRNRNKPSPFVSPSMTYNDNGGLTTYISSPVRDTPYSPVRRQAPYCDNMPVSSRYRVSDPRHTRRPHESDDSPRSIPRLPGVHSDSTDLRVSRCRLVL
jgi:hypothetical protein